MPHWQNMCTPSLVTWICKSHHWRYWTEYGKIPGHSTSKCWTYLIDILPAHFLQCKRHHICFQLHIYKHKKPPSIYISNVMIRRFNAIIVIVFPTTRQPRQTLWCEANGNPFQKFRQRHDCKCRIRPFRHLVIHLSKFGSSQCFRHKRGS